MIQGFNLTLYYVLYHENTEPSNYPNALAFFSLSSIVRLVEFWRDFDWVVATFVGVRDLTRVHRTRLPEILEVVGYVLRHVYPPVNYR